MTTEQLWYYIVMFLCNLCETSFVLLIHVALLGTKPHPDNWWLVKIGLISLGGYLFFANTSCSQSVQIFFAILIYASYTCFFAGKLFQKLLSLSFAVCLLMFVEPLLLPLEACLFSEEIAQFSQSDSVILLNELITLLVGWCIWKFWPHSPETQHLSLAQKIVTIFYPCVSAIMICVITKSLQQKYDPLLFVLEVFLFVCLLVHLILTEMLNSQNERNLKFSLLSQKIASESEKADALQDAYTVQRRLTHEFHNHIQAIKAYAEQNQLEDLKEYIQEISPNTGEQTLVVNTHNPAVDAILSQKYTLARQQSILVFFDLCDLSDTPMATADLVVVLSNLFENAIAASSNLKNGVIKIKVQNTNSEFVLAVRNQVKENVQIRNNMPPKTTQKESGHGMGLLNVIEIAKKYNANYAIQCEQNWFQVTVLLIKETS